MKVRIHFWVTMFILVIMIVFQTYIKDPSIERTIYFLLSLIIISAVLTTINSDKVNLVRKTRESRQQVGQYFVERYGIENKKKQPLLWATVVDLSNISSKINKKIIAWVPGLSSRDYIHRTLLEKRGIFTLGPTSILIGDPFGFFEKKIQFDSIEKIVILPSYQPLKYFPEPTGYLSGGVARKTQNTEVSPYAVSVRDYYPGDPLRRIDWKTTARLDKLMVKEFEEDPQSTVWIFLDSDEQFVYENKNEKQRIKGDDFFWQKKTTDQIHWHQNSFEQQVSIAASICDYYIVNNRFVGFYANGQKQISISPEGGVRQLDKVLEMLASLKPTKDQEITELILSQRNRLGNASTLVIISSNTRFDFVDSLKQLQQKRYSIILITVDPLSYQQQINAEDFYSIVRSLGIKLIIVQNGRPLSE
jgi:uncharacterized protein (DUF58 family)